MLEATHYRKLGEQRVQCSLCPHLCTIENDGYGKCMTRMNKGGKLYAAGYGILSSISSDPIEKKPLYHFYPGRPILSLGGFGCNLGCEFCQNCSISQIDKSVFQRHPHRDPDDLVRKAGLIPHNIGLAYTYNEPIINYEYIYECAGLIKKAALSNVMISNGFINEGPLNDLLPLMDAFNIDLKSFRNSFYEQYTGSRIAPVLRNIERIARSDSHLEITFLLIPGLNDSKEEWKEMIAWIRDHCGKECILHVSRYFPHHKMNRPPTPIETIREFLELAQDNLSYVYPGNTPLMESHTYCPSCGHLLVERTFYSSLVKGIDTDGHCRLCGHRIIGNF